MFPTWYLPMVLLRMMTVRCIFIMPPVIRACTLLPRPLASFWTLHSKKPQTLGLPLPGDYGQVLRAKGIVAGTDGKWLHFDYVPGEVEIRNGAAGVTGRLCVIGAELKEDALTSLFHLN